jgi:membrane protein
VKGWADRAVAAAAQRLNRLRHRSPLIDHVCRAAHLYNKEDGSRLAAAIAYYGFFATFALGVLLFAILGAALTRDSAAQSTAETYLSQNLPLRDVHALADASRGMSVIAFVALVLAGIWWVESMRSSQRALWRIEQHPGNILVRYLVDLAVLVGLGMLLMVSLATSLGLQDILLRLAGDQARPLTRHALDWSSALLAGGVDFVLAAALLAGVPRLRIPLRRLLPSALLIVVGLALLKTGGRWYVSRMTNNPAYQLAASAIGLLIFMYLFNQVILFATALAATSTAGTVRDLAAEPPGEGTRHDTGPAPDPSTAPAVSDVDDPAAEPPLVSRDS